MAILKTNIGIDVETNGTYLRYFDEVSGKIVVKTQHREKYFFTSDEADEFINYITGGTKILIDFEKGQ
jgi:hypothetical protein